MTVGEYINRYPSYRNEIESINTLFAPYGMHVDEVAKGSQIIRYKLLLPDDSTASDKVRKAEPKIKYNLPSVLDADEFIFNRTRKYLYIEKKANEFTPVLFNDHIGNLPAKGLYLLLGKDIDGHNMYTDLSKQKHILVAGTTGAGKSELLHTFIASLITRKKQNPCELILIDPKMSEFSVYKDRQGIDLITDMSKAAEKLSWAVDEMQNRYKLFEQKRCKDIYEYNDASMHHYVIIIDEMADLIMSNKNIEKYIIRLAQKARGCGIHLILGTQRPDKDIVTGLIKANIPSKIALHTTNGTQSRIILDSTGAENLVGNGDMLFLGNGSFKPIRIQAAYLDGKSKNELAASLPIKVQNNSSQNTYNPQSSLAKYMLKNGYSEEDAKAVDRFKAHMDEKEIFNEEHEPIKQTSSISQSTPKRKRMGLFKTLIRLMDVKPLMFVTDEYPPRI